MSDGIGDGWGYILKGYRDLQLSRGKVLWTALSLVILLVYDYISLEKDVIVLINKLPGMVRWTVYYSLIFFIIVAGNFGSTQFVYFQF